MKKKLVYIGVLICIIGCSPSLKSSFDNDFCTPRKGKQEKRVLSSYDALEDKYSLIFLKSRFDNEKILVINGVDTLLNDKILSDPSLSLAKVVRINRNYVTKIIEIDRGYSFVLNVKNTKKGKYIYIMRDPFNPKRIKYEITYSDNLCRFL